MKNPRWVQVKGNYVTPGGDALWACPVCGRKSSWHVYGVEHTDNFSHKCHACGARLLYPWENEDEVNKLKPCPFCGSENIMLGTYHGDVHDVRCVQCQATFVGGSEQECIEKWNRRAIQPMPQSVIDALEKMAEGFAETIYCCNDRPLYPCGVDDPSNKALCKNAMSYKGKKVIYMRGYVLRGNGSITLYYSDRTVETLTIESWTKAAKKK